MTSYEIIGTSAAVLLMIMLATRSIQTRRKFTSALDSIKHGELQIRELQKEVEKYSARTVEVTLERDALKEEVASLTGRLESLSRELQDALMDANDTRGKVDIVSKRVSEIEESAGSRIKELVDWLEDTFSPYLAEVIPETATVVESFANKLNSLGLQDRAAAWYIRLTESSIRYGDLERADRISSVLEGLRPTDALVLKLRRRVLFRLGRAHEATGKHES